MTFARHLRNNLTPEERILWRALSQMRPRFTRQLEIGRFVANFACRRARVVVEVDGSQHIENEADACRAALLEADGWRVARFWNNEVRDNLDGVVAAIAAAVIDRLPGDEGVKFIASRAGRSRNSCPSGEEGPPPGPSTKSWRGVEGR